MLKALREEGLDLDACIRVIEAGEKKADPTNAERQSRYRAKRKRNTVTVTPFPLIEELHIPVSETKVSSTIWPCPANVDPQHWADFRKNRKTKRRTDSATAYAEQIKLIGEFADDEWPPGRLVERAAAKGWATICDPRKPMNGTNYGQANQHSGLGKSAAAAVRAFGDPASWAEQSF